jgi:transcription antitermination protein NusB
LAAKRSSKGERKPEGRKPSARKPAAAKSAAAKPAASKRSDGTRANAAHRPRSLARRLALQALYQIQLNPRSLAETQKQFAADPEADRVDMDYFRSLLKSVTANREAMESRLARLCEISPPELDPIEHAVLWLGLHELEHCLELPYRVALAEAVQLAKQFGATDGHKFVNAVLDRAARELRPHEYGRGQT